MDISDAETIESRTSAEEGNDGTQTRKLKQYEKLQLPPNYRLRELLLEVAPHIKPVFIRVKFYYRDELRGRLNSELNEVEHFFEILWQRRYITPENLIHLQKIVMMIEDYGTRDKLMERIYQFAMSEEIIYFRECTNEPANGFKSAKYHIKGTKAFSMTVPDIRDLQLRVAELLGLTRDEVLIDAVEKSNSLYISFLIPEKHFELLQTLARIGLPSLSNFGVDVISFGEKGFQVSSGKEIKELPPIYRHRDEELAAVRNNRDRLQEENLLLKKEKADLQLKFDALVDDTVKDIDVLRKTLDESLQMANATDCNRSVISDIVTDSLRLGRRIGAQDQKLKIDELHADLVYHKFLNKTTDQERTIKKTVARQVEKLLKNRGQDIDKTEGYKHRIIQGAMEITEKLSKEEIERLHSDKKELLPIDRLSVLHMYCEENKSSTIFVKLENFMKHCSEDREDLVKKWEICLKPSPAENPVQKIWKAMAEQFEVSNGEEVQELPLVYKTRDEELVALQKHRDTLLEENLSLKKEKADLKLKFEGLTDDSVEDIDFLSQKFDKSLQMAYSNGVDRIVISPLVTESLRLGREIGKKHQTLKLDQLEADLAYYRFLHNMTDHETAIKDSVMKQLKILFETGGQSIDETEGYKPRLIKGAIEISEKLSDEEFEKLKSDKETMVQFDRLFVLHLYHEENKRSQTFIRLEKFMQDCLEKLHRGDLAKTWQKYLKPSPDEDPLQKLLKTMEQTLEDLRPGVGLDVKDLLRKTCSRLTKDEKMALKSKLSKEIEVEDDDSVLGLLLFVRDMSSPGRNDLGQLTEFVEKMLDLVGRKDIMEFFMKEMNRLKLIPQRETLLSLLRQQEEKLQSLLKESESENSDTATKSEGLNPEVPQRETLLSLLRQQGEKMKSLLKENESENSDTATKSEGLNPEGIQDLKKFINGETDKIIKRIDANKHSTTVNKCRGENFNFGNSGTIDLK